MLSRHHVWWFDNAIGAFRSLAPAFAQNLFLMLYAISQGVDRNWPFVLFFS